MRLEQRVLDATKFMEIESEGKYSILRVIGVVAQAVYGDGDKSIIAKNGRALQYLLAKNVTTWVMTELGEPEAEEVNSMYPEFSTMFSNEMSIKSGVNKLMEIGNFKTVGFATVEECLESIEYFNLDVEYGEEYEREEVAGYEEEIHGGFRRQIEDLLLNTFEEMYGKFFNGQENIDGFIVPAGALEANRRFQGILQVKNQGVKVTANTISNALYEEFYIACRNCGVEIAEKIEENREKVSPYKYNPMLQLSIANGSMASGRPSHSWREYKEFIREKIGENCKKWAVMQEESGSLEKVYKEMSGYTVNLMVINYREGLGSQVRFNCGDNSKTEMVAREFVKRLKSREKTLQALAMGKLLVGEPVISEGKNCATVSIYQNMAGYQSVPTFMGELLYKMPEGHFKPSIKNMIIGKSLNNEIVTAPFTKWLLPIIAGSRSGKGVLTLNMLLNVIGTGTPLFYLDGKPDMATLLWDLMKKHGIDRGVVVDSVGYQGVTPIDKKPYAAPYKPAVGKSLSREGNSKIIENNMSAFIYLKTMLAIYLGLEYYKTHMGSKYGDLFVVLDEMYVTFVEKVENIFLNMDTEKKKDKEMAGEVKEIEGWIHGLLNKYSGGDVGIFGGGIKAVALTQWANSDMYKTSSNVVNNFCMGFLLRRSTKLYGRQETGGGMYGVDSKKSSKVNFDLYDKYFHFGIGVSNNNTYDSLKTFKPLLVLNENDCKELTGKTQDGVFIEGVMDRIKGYVDTDEFRRNNFSDHEFARTIGFEGALEQVGRLTGSDWKEMLGLSLTRGYDILDEALRYYGLVGDNDIDSVYDFLVDARRSSLVTVDSVLRDKAKGNKQSGLADKQEAQRKTPIESKVSIMSNVVEVKKPLKVDAQQPMDMSKEMKRFYESKNQKVRHQRNIAVADNKAVVAVETKPEEVYYGGESPAFTREGNIIRLNREISEAEGRVDFNRENYRGASMDNTHPINKVSGWFKNTAAGARYELQSRFKFIVDKLDEVVKPNLVTRMIVGEEEVSLNGVFIDVSGIVGGQGEARLCDVISFTKLLKKYKNLKEMSVDRSMLEAMRFEFRSIPDELFMVNKSLQTIMIIDASGNREVMRRGEKNSSRMVEKAERSMEFEAMCNSKNPRVHEKASATYSSVRRGLFGRSKNGATNFLEAVTSRDKSIGRGLINGVASAGLFGLGMMISIPYAVSRLGSLFKV